MLVIYKYFASKKIPYTMYVMIYRPILFSVLLINAF